MIELSRQESMSAKTKQAGHVKEKSRADVLKEYGYTEDGVEAALAKIQQFDPWLEKSDFIVRDHTPRYKKKEEIDNRIQKLEGKTLKELSIERYATRCTDL